jgi:4,5-dihydroxyphthalate decarboxylase
MHVVVIKNAVLEKHPWVALNLQQAFTKAKDKTYEALNQVGSLRVTLPWLAWEVERTKKLMGEDFWPYGVSKKSKDTGKTGSIRL